MQQTKREQAVVAAASPADRETETTGRGPLCLLGGPAQISSIKYTEIRLIDSCQLEGCHNQDQIKILPLCPQFCPLYGFGFEFRWIKYR